MMWLYFFAAAIVSRPLAGQSFSILKQSARASFIINRRNDENFKHNQRRRVVVYLEELERQSTLSYDDTDGASKGLVATLTAIVNSLSPRSQKEKSTGEDRDPTIQEETLSESSARAVASPHTPPPATPQELMERIQLDYVERNYLWTGDLDLTCFEESCRFTDPTISFVGRDTFRENTQNLVPLVNAFVAECRSDLLSILLEDEYIETRWNMVGSLTGSRFLFWKPRIDVIGRTKFWFRPVVTTEATSGDNSASIETASKSSSPYYQVYLYDEEWEIPAYQALLQLITPPGTFPNSKIQALE